MVQMKVGSLDNISRSFGMVATLLGWMSVQVVPYGNSISIYPCTVTWPLAGITTSNATFTTSPATFTTPNLLWFLARSLSPRVKHLTVRYHGVHRLDSWKKVCSFPFYNRLASETKCWSLVKLVWLYYIGYLVLPTSSNRVPASVVYQNPQVLPLPTPGTATTGRRHTMYTHSLNARSGVYVRCSL
jgi:hypothetical protein